MYITRAAILYQGGGIVEGKNYPEIIDLAHRFGFIGTYVSGYLTDRGDFIDRNKAMEVAIKSGQLPADFTGPLAPEDLWGEDDATY
jgi:hypothetical protein